MISSGRSGMRNKLAICSVCLGSEHPELTPAAYLSGDLSLILMELIPTAVTFTSDLSMDCSAR